MANTTVNVVEVVKDASFVVEVAKVNNIVDVNINEFEPTKRKQGEGIVDLNKKGLGLNVSPAIDFAKQPTDFPKVRLDSESTEFVVESSL